MNNCSVKEAFENINAFERLVNSYKSMVKRCLKKGKRYTQNYGDRGIRVCERWLGPDGPLNFLSDVGLPPENHTLDRINPDGDYEPDNVRWASKKVQSLNKRNSVYVDYKGKQRLLAELCEEQNMKLGLVHNRIFQYGWDIERALSEPIKPRQNFIVVTWNGEKRKLVDVLRELGITSRTDQQRIRERINSGWSVEAAIKQPIIRDGEPINIDGESRTLTEWCQHLNLDYRIIWQRIRRRGWSPEKSIKMGTPKTYQDYLDYQKKEMW